jgi:hypothetical protein
MDFGRTNNIHLAVHGRNRQLASWFGSVHVVISDSRDRAHFCLCCCGDLP